MQHLMRQLANSPYMPSRDQIIQLVTTVVTLLMMTLLGPAMAGQAGLIQVLVRQIVPLIVVAGVHYAADKAAPMQDPMYGTRPAIGGGDIAPVKAQQSAYASTI